MDLVTVSHVPVLRTGHFELESGSADFAIEHLHAAAAALANDPAILPLRIRLELADQGHLDMDGMTAEARGGMGGPAVGWGDNYTVEGNTLYADLHVPELVAGSMEWAFPGRSIEGLFGWQTATGQRHDFVATGLLLLGTSWPGVTTLPDFHEVQAEFAAAIASGEFTAATFAAQPDAAPVAAAAVCARVGVTGRPPLPAREQMAAAGLNVGDLRMRWYGAESDGELAGLPDSYDYTAWYVLEVRADDDGTLYVIVLDESSGRMWRFDVTSISGATVTWAEPYEIVMEPIAVTARAASTPPRPALARFTSRADSRAPTASADNSPNQEDDDPMNDALRRTLAARHGLDPETATEDQIMAAETTAAENPPADPAPGTPAPSGEADPEGTADPAAELIAARTTTISRERLAELERGAADGAAARAAQIATERDTAVSAAVADGRITPAEAPGWRTDFDKWPDAMAASLARLEKGKYPGARASAAVQPQDGTRPNSLTRALAASGLPTTDEKGA